MVLYLTETFKWFASWLECRGAVAATFFLCNLLLMPVSGCSDSAIVTEEPSPPQANVELGKKVIPFQIFTLNLRSPSTLVKDAFPEIFAVRGKLDPEKSLTDTVEKIVSVIVKDTGSDNQVEFQAEMIACHADPLIPIKSRTTDFCQLRLSVHSVPGSLEEIHCLAKSLCKFAGIESAKIDRWVAGKKYERPLHRALLSTGILAKTYISIDIRQSFEEKKPWRVILSLSFN